MTIPAEALAVSLSGYVWISQPNLNRMPFDWAVFEFLDPSIDADYQGVWQVELWNDMSVTNGWVYFEAQQTDVSRMAGRALQLSADSRPNGDGTLSVWLDSLRVEARCAR